MLQFEVLYLLQAPQGSSSEQYLCRVASSSVLWMLPHGRRRWRWPKGVYWGPALLISGAGCMSIGRGTLAERGISDVMSVVMVDRGR
jgi:hypothetical protein